MDAINISNWNNKQVLDWLKGLDISIQRYCIHFKEADVLGEQLLSLTNDDLNSLQIHLVGHQELILDSVTLLQQLDYGLESETLQSRALCLKCRCRSLRSSINTRRREAEEYEYDGGNSLQRGATNQLLQLSADLLVEGKQLVLWLDRAPFNTKNEFKDLRHTMVKLCYELSTTVQQSVFACVIEDATLGICQEIENSADSLVQSNDALTIQPVTLELVTLKDIDPQEGLGLFIKVTFEGHHVITGTRQGSVASKAKRITAGDEVVAVNGKAVIGWSLGSLVSALKEVPNKVMLLIKKRPQNMFSSSTSNLLTLMQRQDVNDRTRQMRTSAPVKRINLPPGSPTPLPIHYPDVTQGNPPGSWSHDQHGTSLDRGAYVSEYDRRNYNKSINSIESYNSSNARYSTSSNSTGPTRSTPPDRSRQSSLIRGGEPALISSSLHEEPTSPINMFSIPPPPEEPYQPKPDRNKLAPPKATHRAESPNSMLDNDHQRRHTVIGDSTVDQVWFDELLTQVNKCSFPPSSGRPSQEQISSAEDVFLSSTPQSSASSISRKGNQDPAPYVSYRRRGPSANKRPISMPPNYYNNALKQNETREQLRPLNSGAPPVEYRSRAHSSQSRHASEDQYRLRYTSAKKRQLPSNQQWAPENQRQNSSRLRQFNANYNNNNSQLPNQEIIPSSTGRPRSLTAPKPPPRSSSISKLTHRYSADASSLHQICHPRQASLPTHSTVPANMSTNLEHNVQQKPAIAEKPSNSIQSLLKSKVSSKRKEKKKRTRSASTPTLLTPEQREEALENKTETSPKLSQKSSSPKGSLDRINNLKSELRNQGMKISVRGSPPPVAKKSSPSPQIRTSSPLRSSPSSVSSPPPLGGKSSPEKWISPEKRSAPLPTTSSPPPVAKKPNKEVVMQRPVPKPRKSLKRNKSLDLLKDEEKAPPSALLCRSQSQDTDTRTSQHMTSPPPLMTSSPRREQRINGMIDRLNMYKKDPDQQVSQPQPQSPASRSPQSTRVSYTAAIEKMGEMEIPAPQKQSPRSKSVPHLHENFDVKIVAGVPVRLRKPDNRPQPPDTLMLRVVLSETPENSDKSRVGNFLTAEMKSQRRISCKDLGRGDCQGWLWKKKTAGGANTGGPLTQKWAKRWVVIKEGAIYCYRSNDEDDERRAESYISLPGYKIAPAPECKRKLAFRISHPKRKTFFFAADRQMDMSKWMNKMGLASIEYKFEGLKNQPEDSKSKDFADEQYFSESDTEESRSAGDRSSTDLEKLCESRENSPEKNKFLAAPDKTSPTAPDNKHLINEPISVQVNGHVRSRSQSESMKLEQDIQATGGLSPASSINSVSVTRSLTSLPPSPSRVKPNVTPEQRRHRGGAGRKKLDKTLSKSLDSLSLKTLSESDEEEKSKYLKAKEVAAERAKNIRMRQASVPNSPTIRINNPEPSTPPLTPQEEPKSSSTASAIAALFSSKRKKKKRKSTASVAQSDFYTRPRSTEMDEIPTRSSLAPHPSLSHASSSPALTNLATNLNPSTMAVNPPRRDGAGRPKLAVEDSPRRDSTPSASSSTSNVAAKDAAAALCAELEEKKGIGELFSAIKHAEVDFQGTDRRATLRRKMTMLSRDPVRNEKMLKKRALQRELKAKEQELIYVDNLLCIPDLTSDLLHDWINQHPSLLANMGTIRRMSKKRRHRVESSDFASPSDGGDRDTDSLSNSRVSSSGSDVTSPGVAGNHNDNNNKPIMRSPLPSNISRDARPRSWAMSHTNGEEPTPGSIPNPSPDVSARKPAQRMSSSPVTSTSNHSPAKHKRIASHRPMVRKHGNSNPKPYLETDL
uniref:Connector enhancer of kinase suppressor of ras 2-like n=1 Tax=Phallusia mammillata TaxID=59560 RepID=A0A6F9DA95_9ASCI|nr:connector enhancer of kinase suppressor of ras 2-like [Phallusia mammillata]